MWVGEIVTRCAGFFATEGGGPLSVLCEATELVEVERGAGGGGAGAGADFLAMFATEGTGVWFGGGGKNMVVWLVDLLGGGAGGGAGGASIFLNWSGGCWSSFKPDRPIRACIADGS